MSRAEKHKVASPPSAGSHRGGAWQCRGRFWSLLQFLPAQSKTPGCPEKRELPGARGQSKGEVEMVGLGGRTEVVKGRCPDGKSAKLS